jgi:hypothetical protein
MLCHAQTPKSSEVVARLAALKKDTPIVPEKPLYRLPDFVMFSHARHKTATISCDSCHGNVWANDALELQLPMKMKACVDCHKTSHAVVTCTACHELSQ